MHNAFHILPQEYRRRGVVVAGTLFLRALLNFVGLAVLLPVLALVLDPQGIAESGPLKAIYEWSGMASAHGFALAICAGVVAVIVVKCLLNVWLARFERNYIYDLYRTLSRQLYISYHDRGLPFIKSRNSAQLSRNINVVCLAFTAGVMRPVAAIAVETTLFILLFGALTVYTPLAAGLTVVVFLPGIWLYYGLVRKRIVHYGEVENKAQREKARIVAETFRGYADIEISGAFPMMLRTFDRTMDEIIRIRAKEFTIGILPQTFTEIGLAVGMALLAAISIGSGAGHGALLFGAFAVAALRLMPSVRNIMGGWTSIRYNRYTLDILREAGLDTSNQALMDTSSSDEHTDGIQSAGSHTADSQSVENQSTGSHTVDSQSAASQSVGNQSAESHIAAAITIAETTEKLPFECEIAARNLTFHFEDDEHELFRDFSLTIHKGDRIGIRGASGAGKTTLFNLLLGLYQPTEGQITIDGRPLTPENRRAWHNRIGYVSQNLFLVDSTFTANVALGVAAEKIDRERVEKALQVAQLGDFVAALPQGAETPVGECGCRISGGQRQRIGIARALYRQADVLFFDEATSALDSRTEEEINLAIAGLTAQQQGMTLIIIAHRESSLEYCNRIITIGE